MSRPRIVLVSLLVTSLLAVAYPASAAIRAGRLAIGDSVMKAATTQLKNRGFRIVDTATSRQFSQADDRIRYWRSRGKLPRNVVVHLGNNGYIYDGDCARAVKAAGAGRTIFLVTVKVPRRWQAPNNRRLRDCASRFARARLIDWYGYSKGHGAWFYSDGYHLTPTGRAKYASFIAGKVAAA